MKKMHAPDNISSLPSVKNTLYLDLIVAFCAPLGPRRTCSTVRENISYQLHMSNALPFYELFFASLLDVPCW